MARLRQVIEVEITRGKGVDTDPLRRIVQYWSTEGEELLAESKDPYPPSLRPSFKKDDRVRKNAPLDHPWVLGNNYRAPFRVVDVYPNDNVRLDDGTIWPSQWLTHA